MQKIESPATGTIDTSSSRRKRIPHAETVGMKFNRLTVVKIVRHGSNITTDCLCRCECGTTKVMKLANVTAGLSQSCGCLMHEFKRANFKHGMSETREFNSWLGMIARVENPKNQKFYRYGGRGIRICSRWRNSFNDFYADMGPKPNWATLGRIDNDGDYCPTNCRWETQKQQASNRRTSRFVEVNGQRMTFQEAIRQTKSSDYFLRNGLKESTECVINGFHIKSA